MAEEMESPTPCKDFVKDVKRRGGRRGKGISFRAPRAWNRLAVFRGVNAGQILASNTIHLHTRIFGPGFGHTD